MMIILGTQILTVAKVKYIQSRRIPNYQNEPLHEKMKLNLLQNNVPQQFKRHQMNVTSDELGAMGMNRHLSLGDVSSSQNMLQRST